MILWDSKERRGRPDTIKLLKETWHSFGAEVIFITSNMQGNDEMMQGCRAGTYFSSMPYGKSLIIFSWAARIWHPVGLLIPQNLRQCITF